MMALMQSRLTSLVVAALVVLAATPVNSQRDFGESNTVCTGIFDFYVILDSSGSVEGQFHSEMVPFVRKILMHYAEPDFRVAILTFATEAKVHLNLTRIANRNSIETGMTSLKEHVVGGRTHLAPALITVNNLINLFGGDRASIVLVVTDGRIHDLSRAKLKSKITRSKGSSVFAIGLGNATRFNELSEITGRGDRVSIGHDTTFLDQILNKVVNDTCIEITSVTPTYVCGGSTNNITISGRGFTNQLVKGRASCRFKSDTGVDYTTQPKENITYNRIVCSSPQNINSSASSLLLQVTTNGITFFSSDVTVTVNNSCPVSDFETVNVNAAITDAKTSTPNLDGVLVPLAAMVLLLVLVLLLLFWYFFPLITCKVEGGLPPEKKEEQSAVGKGTPGRTWEVVDASYYGGRGAGGIRPMTVKWGEKGATETGEKLQKAKEAKVITVKRQPSRPPPPRPRLPPRNKPGCWKTVKAKLVRWYTVLASYRPVFTIHGSRRKISWCSKSKYLSKNTAYLV